MSEIEVSEVACMELMALQTQCVEKSDELRFDGRIEVPLAYGQVELVVPVEPQLIVEAEKYQRIEQNVVLFVFDGMGIEPLSEFQILPAIVDGDAKIGVAAVIGEAVMARFAESKLVDQGIDAVYNLPVFHPLECTEL